MEIDLHDDDLIELLIDLETNSPIEYELLMKNEPEMFRNQNNNTNSNHPFIQSNTSIPTNQNRTSNEFYNDGNHTNNHTNGYIFNNNSNHGSNLNEYPKSIKSRNINTFPLTNETNTRSNITSIPPANKPSYTTAPGTNDHRIIHPKTSSYSTSSSSHYIPTAHNISSQSIVFEDYSPQDMATESRIKSYELRLKGQIRTIRSLESQLTQAQQVNQEQSKYLLISQNRIKSLESKERSLVNKQNQQNNNHNTNGNGSNNNELRTAIQKFDEQLITKYEEALQTLETKCTEETSKRLKSEERSRSFKEYYDKLKLENSSLETQLKGLFKSNHDLTHKLTKYKKEYKELMAEVSVQREDIQNKVILIDQQRDRIKRAELAMRTTLNEMSKLRDEAQFQHKECMNAHSLYKLAQSEIIALKEREVSRRAELKLQQVTGSSSGGSGNGSSSNSNNNNNIRSRDNNNEEESVILSARSQAQSRSLLHPDIPSSSQQQRYVYSLSPQSQQQQQQQSHHHAHFSSSVSDPGAHYDGDDMNYDDFHTNNSNNHNSSNIRQQQQYGSFTTNDDSTATRPPRHPRSNSGSSNRNRPSPTGVRRGSDSGTVSDSEALHSPYRHHKQQYQSRSKVTADIPQYRKPTSSSSASLQAHRNYADTMDNNDNNNDDDGNTSFYSMHSLLGKLHSQGRLSENSSPTHSPSRVRRGSSAASNSNYKNNNSGSSGSGRRSPKRSSSSATTTTDRAGVRGEVSKDDGGVNSISNNNITSTVEELKWEAIKQKAAADAKREFLLEQQQQAQQRGGLNDNIDDDDDNNKEDQYSKLKRMYKRVTGHNINKLDRSNNNNNNSINHHDDEDDEDSY